MRVAPEVGGRVVELTVAEGDRVAAGDVIARLDTADTELASAAPRPSAIRRRRSCGCCRPAPGRRTSGRRAAQVESAQADVQAARGRARSGRPPTSQRFEALLRANAGSRKQRDDAATRREVAAARVRGGAGARARRAEAVARLQAGARPQEIDAARARVAAADAQIAALQKSLADADVKSPVAGIVTAKLVDAGEMVAPRDAGGRRHRSRSRVGQRLRRRAARAAAEARPGRRRSSPTPGSGWTARSRFISPKAEFTPRNVQTADERSKLVYRDQGDGRQPRRHPEAGHAGRSGAPPRWQSMSRRLRFVRRRHEALRRGDARSTRVIVRRRARRDVRPDRPRRRRQDDGDPPRLRAAAAPTADASRVLGRDPVARAPRHHRRGRLPVAALQPLRRSDHRREHRVLRRDPRRRRATRRRATGCST